MITERHALAALKYLHDTGHVRSTDGQARTWADALATQHPEFEGDDLAAAVRAYAVEAIEPWTTLAHLVPYIRRANHLRTLPPKCDGCDQQRHIETGDGIRRCPTCHPAEAAIDDGYGHLTPAPTRAATNPEEN